MGLEPELLYGHKGKTAGSGSYHPIGIKALTEFGRAAAGGQFIHM
jgi:hypothetical protein